MSFLSVLVLLAACTSQPGDDARGAPAAPPETASPSPTSRPNKVTSAQARCRQRVAKVKHQQFVPETNREGAREVLPAVFPDGSTAELVYPPALNIAELGVQPAVSAGIVRGKHRFAAVRFLLITKTPIKKFRSEDPAIKTYEGASGTVKVRRAKDPEEFLNPVFLHFRIGTWNILVGDGNVGTFMGARNRRLWAENLDGYETENGFIVLDPRPPLVIGTGPGGPDLLFSECFRFVEFRLEECRDLKAAELAKKQTAQVVRDVTVHRSKSGGQFHANWCTPSRRVSVYLDDRNKRFVDLAVKRLRVRNVELSEVAKSDD